MFPYGKTITFTPQTVDNFGTRTAGSPVDVAGCVVYQVPGIETVVGQDTLVYELTVIAPPGTTVDPTDTVTIDGNEYEIASQAIEWQSPFTGTDAGVQFTARRVVG